jgi:hypothetical protein
MTCLLILVVAFARLPLDARQEAAATSDLDNQNWTHRVRIAGYDLGRTPPAAIVRDATDSHVFGIEVDNDITGRYESFLDPDAKLAAIRALATEAHAAGNRAFVYIAGTECITKDADSTPHTLAKDHPTHVMSGSNDLPTRRRIFGLDRETRADPLRTTVAHPSDRRVLLACDPELFS